MPRICLRWKLRFTLLVSALVLAAAAPAAHAIGSVMFDTQGTSDKPQSKLWFHDSSWWACINDLSKLAIYECTGTGWTKKRDVQNAAIPTLAGGTSDVLWTGERLVVGVFGSSTSKVYEYTYDAVNRNWTPVAGFPINLAMQTGAETIVLDQDSTGRLWATFEANGRIYVYYTTSADHLQWIGSPFQISTQTVDVDDISTVVAFAPGRVGVLWTDQRQHQVCFRWREDTDPPGTWQPIEIVRSGFGVVDDHLNLKADSQGNVYFVAKDYFDAVWVGRRTAATSTWNVTTGASGLDCGTRPMIQIDEFHNKIYVFYTRWAQCVSTGTHAIEERVAYLDNLLFSLPTQLVAVDGVSMNEVSGTKQVLQPGSVVIVAQGSNNKAYWYGWGALSNIGGEDPGGNFPPPPVAPANVQAQTVTESQQPRMLLWRLDSTSGATATDASGNNRNGTLGAGAEAPHWVPGLVNNGLYFDGDDYVTASGSSFAFTASSFTLEAWVKIDLTNAPGTGMLFARGDLVHSTFALSVSDPEIEFGWSLDDTLDVSVKAMQSLWDGSWHHVAAVYDANIDRARIFVDGQVRATKTMLGPTYATSWPLTVGALRVNGLLDTAFTGHMDLVAITNSAVYSNNFTPPLLYPSSSTRYVRLSYAPSSSQAGIMGYAVHRKVNGGATVLLNSTLTPNPWYADFTPVDGFVDYSVTPVDGLTQQGSAGSVSITYASNPPQVPGAPQGVGSSFVNVPIDASPYWEMDEGSGSTTADGTGLGHTAQLGSSAQNDNAQPTWVIGKTGQALRFDGSNDYVEVADAPDLRFTGSFTVEAWARRTQLNEIQAIVAKDQGSSRRNYMILFNSNNTVEFAWRDDDGSTTRRVTSTVTVLDTNWHHVAGVFDETLHQSRLYLDGVQVASGTTNGTPYVGSEPVRFGARGSSTSGISDLFTGDIDLVRIGSGVRYTDTFTPPEILHGGGMKQAVVLSWGLPPNGLVEDYQVYRQVLPSGSNTLLGTVEYMPSPTWLDTSVLAGTSYRYTVRARNTSSVAGPPSEPYDVEVLTPVDVAEGAPAARFGSLHVEPNPFNPTASVRFALAAAGEVDLALYDARGRRLATLVHGKLAAGPHRILLDGSRIQGGLASGVYFIELRAEGRSIRRKAILLR